MEESSYHEELREAAERYCRLAARDGEEAEA